LSFYREPIYCLLHLGGQVHNQPYFEDAWLLLRRFHAETAAGGSGEGGASSAREAVEERVRERLRDAYRFTWNLPFTRETLASCSNLMIWGDRDVYHNFTLSQQFRADLDLEEWTGADPDAGAKNKAGAAAGGGASGGRGRRNRGGQAAAKKDSEDGGVKAKGVAGMPGGQGGRTVEWMERQTAAREKVVIRTLLRLSVQVYREYQRQLWDPKADELSALEDSFASAIREQQVAQQRCTAKEQELSMALAAQADCASKGEEEAALRAARLAKHLKKDLRELTERRGQLSKTPLPEQLQAGEMVWSVSGELGVLLLDMRSNRLGSDGVQAADNPILSEEQWNCIEQYLSNEHVRVLVVGAEWPIVYDDPQRTARLAGGVKSKSGAENDEEGAGEGQEHLRGIWEYEPTTQHRLLERLFTWRKGLKQIVGGGVKPRQCVLVAGGLAIGLESVILDKRTNEPMTQLTVGPLTQRCAILHTKRHGFAGAAMPDEVRMAAMGTKERGDLTEKTMPRLPPPFEFEHHPLLHQRNYGMLTLDTAKGTAESWLVGQYYERVEVLVGPIVGKVTSSTAIVLLEVDVRAPVCAVLTDSVTHQQHRVLLDMPARRPIPFVFQQLLPDHHYRLHVEGVANSASRMGSLTTMPSDEAETEFINFIAVSGDSPTSLNSRPVPSHLWPQVRAEKAKAVAGPGGGGGSLYSVRSDGSGNAVPPVGAEDELLEAANWELISSVAEPSWGGADVHIHLGGQVHMAQTAAVQAAAVLVQRKQPGPQSTPTENKAAEDEVLERLRDAYRTHWNLPSTRRALAHGSHLMVPSEADTLTGDEAEAEAAGAPMGVGVGQTAATMRRLLRTVYREYQRQLWDPECVTRPAGTHARGGASEHAYHQWGRVGLFCLDTRGCTVGANGHTREAAAAKLIGADQWKALNRALASPGLKTLIVGSEYPLLDDSPIDARAKVASSPTLAKLRRRWPYNGQELQKLLAKLFEWKQEQGEPYREVVLLCGGLRCALDTAIFDAPKDQNGRGREETPCMIRQLTSGPVTGRCEVHELSEQGSVGERFTYQHMAMLPRRNVGVLQLRQMAGHSSDSVSVRHVFTDGAAEAYSRTHWKRDSDDAHTHEAARGAGEEEAEGEGEEEGANMVVGGDTASGDKAQPKDADSAGAGGAKGEKKGVKQGEKKGEKQGGEEEGTWREGMSVQVLAEKEAALAKMSKPMERIETQVRMLEAQHTKGVKRGSLWMRLQREPEWVRQLLTWKSDYLPDAESNKQKKGAKDKVGALKLSKEERKRRLTRRLEGERKALEKVRECLGMEDVSLKMQQAFESMGSFAEANGSRLYPLDTGQGAPTTEAAISERTHLLLQRVMPPMRRFYASVEVVQELCPPPSEYVLQYVIENQAEELIASSKSSSGAAAVENEEEEQEDEAEDDEEQEEKGEGEEQEAKENTEDAVDAQQQELAAALNSKAKAKLFSLELVDPTSFAGLCRGYFETAALIKARSLMKQ
jgi:hypothetical protein